MTRETKIGLLIGMGTILLIGIFLTDHLSVARTRQLPNMTDFAAEAQHGLIPPTVIETDDTSNRSVEAPRTSTHRHTQESERGRRHRRPAPNPRPVLHVFENRTTQVDRAEVPSATPHRTADDADRVADRRAPGSITDRTATAPAAIVHTVRPGEGLWELAQRYYGHGRHWQLIREANRGAVAADDTIRSGAKLRIPDVPQRVDQALRHPNGHPNGEPNGGPREAPRPVAPPQNARPTAEPIRVAAGDTFSTLAQQHLGTSRKWRVLFEANQERLDISEPQELRSGMTLHLPGRSRLATDRETPPRQATGQPYVVARGDSLSSLATRLLGDAKHWRRIYEANRDRLSDPDTLPIGRRIVIPR